MLIPTLLLCGPRDKGHIFHSGTGKLCFNTSSTVTCKKSGCFLEDLRLDWTILFHLCRAVLGWSIAGFKEVTNYSSYIFQKQKQQPQRCRGKDILHCLF